MSAPFPFHHSGPINGPPASVNDRNERHVDNFSSVDDTAPQPTSPATTHLPPQETHRRRGSTHDDSRNEGRSRHRELPVPLPRRHLPHLVPVRPTTSADNDQKAGPNAQEISIPAPSQRFPPARTPVFGRSKRSENGWRRISVRPRRSRLSTYSLETIRTVSAELPAAAISTPPANAETPIPGPVSLPP